jgi:hypothetical protein
MCISLKKIIQNNCTSYYDGTSNKYFLLAKQYSMKVLQCRLKKKKEEEDAILPFQNTI